MENFPLSVIISVYKGSEYIGKCIESLINQTFQSFDFILIDDRGDDGTYDKAKSIVEKSILSGRTKYIRHDRNRGIAAARNSGIAAVNTEYIIFLDSDDYFEPNLLEDLYNTALKQSADLVISDFYREMPGNKTIYAKDTFDVEIITEQKERERYIKEMLTSVKGCALWNKLIRKELFSSNKIAFHDNMRDDFSVSPLLVCVAPKIAFVPKPLLHFVQYNSSSGTYSFNHLPFVGNALVHLETFFKARGLDYSTAILRYKANTKRKMFLHPKPEMTTKEILEIFPEVDEAIKRGERLEPKIQYQLLLQLAGKGNKTSFYIYRFALRLCLQAIGKTQNL